MSEDTPSVEPAEVEAVLDSLVGQRDPDDLSWYERLTSRQVLLQAAVDQLGRRRRRVLANWHTQPGVSYATIAACIGLSRARVQKMIEKGAAVMTIASTGWEWADGVCHPEQEDSGSPWDEVRQAVERLPRPWWQEARNAGDAAAAAVDVNPFGNDVDIARRVRHRYAAYAAVVARFWAQAAVEASRPGGVLHEG